MRKFKWFFDFDKEALWLNKMAGKGFLLESKTFGYRFRKAKPVRANYKIDFRQFSSQGDFDDYLMLFRDSGWEHISGTKTSGSQYFIQASSEAEADIFSDADSKAGRYKRLSQMYLTLFWTFLPILTALIVTDAIEPMALLNIKELYFTPGLWEKEGARFWSAFLFETPFALMRGASWLVLPVMLILYLVFSAKAERLYRETKDSGTLKY
ncbi:DUF2812 domain-containing protein [Bacillus infantis]|uniref:DUF2812 domain-containing protein n=1 Tax=Bacillus infantis TaxID=324767 RepID=UPI002006AACE|nr:DUF2812 domain-containing protein [Bacillus infantis]MCK6208085.1 DUF2812 domain-containing protein [Bacillus infantis]